MQSGAFAQSRITHITTRMALLAAVYTPRPQATAVAVLEPPVVETSEPAFEAPANFLEFQERYLIPGRDYIKTHLINKMGVKPQQLDDYYQEIVTLLLTPVMKDDMPTGVDRIAHYNRDLQAGESSTQGHFLKWVRTIITNKVINIRKKENRDASSTFLSFQFVDTEAAAMENGSAYCDYQRVQKRDVAQAEDAFAAILNANDARFVLDGFRSYLRRVNDVTVLRALDYFLDFDTNKDIAEEAGVSTDIVKSWKQKVNERFTRYQRWSGC